MTAPQQDLPAVVVDGVSKTFVVPHQRFQTFKERALHPLTRFGHDRLEALKDVSFAVAPGEFFGIVGRNGSGKSTLLKCMAGIYRLDSGQIYVNGRLSTFIELGVGFNLDLAARDNVTLNGIMLGLSPKEARERFDRVIEFAELEEFVDLRLKNYSSGMHVRLAFSVMIQVDADVLLIDEVLAVGDAAFQQKCFDTFHRMKDEGKTILFVSHDVAAVKRFCDRALLIERGDVKMIGDAEEVATNYLEVNFGREGGREETGEERYGDQGAEIVEAWFEDEHGERAATLTQGRPTRFAMRVAFRQAATDPNLAVAIENEAGQALFATSTAWIEDGSHSFVPGDETVFAVSFDCAFAPGRIFASPWVSPAGSQDVLDRRPRMISAIVQGMHASGALVDLPHDVTLESAGRIVTGKATLA